MNFNNLPDDIKRKIFDVNRKKQIEIEKDKFSMVMGDLKDVVKYNKTASDYDEENPIDELLCCREELINQGTGLFIWSLDKQ
tara:strand:- start:876 stop:1121 length:246 start_codon:yes stop_codon:yes gene_type:complete